MVVVINGSSGLVYLRALVPNAIPLVAWYDFSSHSPHGVYGLWAQILLIVGFGFFCRV